MGLGSWICFGLPFWGWGAPAGARTPSPLAAPGGGALTGAARGTFTVRAWPQVAVVPFGGSVAINCSHSGCPDPASTLGLETSLTKNAAEAGGSWQKFVLLNVSEWSPRPAICHATCGEQRATATATVLVYRECGRRAGGGGGAVGSRLHPTARRVPERVVLEPVPAVAVGESLNLTCRVAEAAPLANLTVTLRRGGETLRTQSFGAAAGSASVAVSHLLTVGPGDHGQDLQAPARLEAGAAANASCRVVGAFPAEDAHFSLLLEGRSLDVAVTEAGDTLTASTRLAPRTAGLQELNCTVTVGAAARTARAQLHVYRFPEPVLELSPVPAGGEVTVRCHAAAAEPPAVRLQLRDADGGVLAEGPQPQLELRLVAQREDDGRWFGCRASLAVGDGTGTREALTCGATGNPAPTVTCARGGATVSTQQPELVTRSRAGTYLCNATNSLGTRSRLVTVRVEYEPSLTESGCPAHRTWVEGERRELACRAEGDPAPSTRCTRDEGPPGTGGGRAVSRSDAGRYTCRATNKHGSALRSVYVSVECE
ncbi:Intercellular adhesion molecule 1 [Aix galericulata]|nr:Intercellular adhesion molecule 1 [Aix galericulata]